MKRLFYGLIFALVFTANSFGADTRYEESSSSIAYSGTWDIFDCPDCEPCSGTDFKYSEEKGAEANFAFDGVGVKWIATKGKMMGKADVYLDSASMGSVNLYSPQFQYQQVVFEKAGLSPGRHTLAIKVPGGEKARSKRLRVNIDAFDVSGYAYFSDNFESGLGNWVVSGYDWDLTTSAYRSATHSLTDSPSGDYKERANVSATLAYALDLSNSTAPMLTFWHKYHLYVAHAFISVEISKDYGFKWDEVAHWYNGELGTWNFVQIDLRAYKSHVKIRFRTQTWSEASAGGWYIDDMEIKELQ